jgi:hypothetical protein
MTARFPQQTATEGEQQSCQFCFQHRNIGWVESLTPLGLRSVCIFFDRRGRCGKCHIPNGRTAGGVCAGGGISGPFRRVAEPDRRLVGSVAEPLLPDVSIAAVVEVNATEP